LGSTNLAYECRKLPLRQLCVPVCPLDKQNIWDTTVVTLLATVVREILASNMSQKFDTTVATYQMCQLYYKASDRFNRNSRIQRS